MKDKMKPMSPKTKKKLAELVTGYGNQKKVAESLGVTRQHIHHMNRYGWATSEMESKINEL